MKHKVQFISLEEDDKDLIVSFAIDDLDMGVKSLTLLRTLFYEEIMDELYNEKEQVNLKQAEAAVNNLAKFNINAWQYGSEFYLKKGALQWKNLIGILITAIFLSFGAPFWFDRLQEAIKLKDMLSEGIKPKKGQKEDEKPEK